MAVTDLRGTKWRLNETIEYDDTFPTYNITYKAYYNSGADFNTGSSLYMQSYIETEGPSISFYGLLGNGLSNFYGTFFPDCIYEGNTSTMFPTTTAPVTLEYIEFTGGTDATNPDLIAWLEANAEQISEPTGNEYTLTQNLTNLTNGNITLTITADEGYSLPAQSGITVTGGSIVSYDDTTGELVVTAGTTAVEVTCESATPSGYEVTLSVNNQATSSSVSFYDGQDSSSTLLATVAKGNSTTVTVTSGYIYFLTSTQDETIVRGDLDDTGSYAPPQFCYAVTGDGSITINPSL